MRLKSFLFPLFSIVLAACGGGTSSSADNASDSSLNSFALPSQLEVVTNENN